MQSYKLSPQESVLSFFLLLRSKGTTKRMRAGRKETDAEGDDGDDDDGKGNKTLAGPQTVGPTKRSNFLIRAYL